MYNNIIMIRLKMYSCGIFTFIVCIIYTLQNVQSDYILSINANSDSKQFTHFWKSTGFCPPGPRNKICEYLLSNDVKTNLLLISKLPNKSIKYVRIHWILDLISISYFKTDGTPVYNFKCTDTFFDWMYSQKLYFGFELMGNPSSYFNNFLNEKQKRHWELLIRNLVLRYADRFGVKYISKWRFETWNEPDLKQYNTLNFSLPSYLSYVSSSFDALNVAGQQIIPYTKFRFGGPAGLFKNSSRHPLCWGLLANCEIFNCSLSFLSFHKKGDGSANEVLNKGLQIVQDIRKKYPKLKQIPIANDEADILTGWSKSVEWRSDTRYAAMIVKVIIDHYNKIINELDIKIEILSNDNGFLNYHPYYFTQRTLLTRFQMNNTSPPHIQFIKKPVYTTMALLSFLGNKALNVSVDKNFSFLATTCFKNKVYEFSTIISYVNDTKQNHNHTKSIEVFVRDLPKYKYKYVVYLLNNVQSNPYKVWKEFGEPVFPNQTVIQKMRQAEGPIRLFPPTDLLLNTNLSINIPVLLPTVALLHICSYGDSPPGKVTELQIYNVTKDEILIVWKDYKVKTKCIKTYEIEYQSNSSESNNQLYKRINQYDTIFLSFYYRGDNEIIGKYRVRAIDYWGRFGPYSNSVYFQN